MSMPNPTFTNAGLLLMLNALDGEPLFFSRIALGDGRLSTQAPATLTTLIHEVVDVIITRSTRHKDYLSLGGPFSPASLPQGFWWRELGVYAKGADDVEVLYCYANAFDLGEYIEPDSEQLERIITVGVAVGNAENISVSLDDTVAYASASDITALNLEMSRKAGRILIGSANLINELEPGGILFITDDNSAIAEAVTLEKLLVQGYLSAKGLSNTLNELITVSVARCLNMRRDTIGSQYNEQNYNELAQQIHNLSAAAIDADLYVNHDVGRIEVTWQQTQFFIIYGRLVDSQTAALQAWPWYSTPTSEYAALRREVAALRASIGDIDATLDEVNHGGGS